MQTSDIYFSGSLLDYGHYGCYVKDFSLGTQGFEKPALTNRLMQ